MLLDPPFSSTCTAPAKAAEIRFTKTLAAELGPFNINVNVVAPGWIETDRFDVNAKAAKPSNIDELHIMFQNLLADEFGLQFHREIKQGAVYALMVDKQGTKMKVNETAQDFEIPIRFAGFGELIGKRVPMPYLVWTLGQILQRDERPVIDKTGLDKVYDFTLSFSPDLPPGARIEDPPPGLTERPNLFNALRDQLGLKLEPQKGPIEMFVIDHATKPDGK